MMQQNVCVLGQLLAYCHISHQTINDYIAYIEYTYYLPPYLIHQWCHKTWPTALQIMTTTSAQTHTQITNGSFLERMSFQFSIDSIERCNQTNTQMSTIFECQSVLAKQQVNWQLQLLRTNKGTCGSARSNMKNWLH